MCLRVSDPYGGQEWPGTILSGAGSNSHTTQRQRDSMKRVQEEDLESSIQDLGDWDGALLVKPGAKNLKVSTEEGKSERWAQLSYSCVRIRCLNCLIFFTTHRINRLYELLSVL